MLQSVADILSSIRISGPAQNKWDDRYNIKEKQFSASYVRERVTYDPHDGSFYWRCWYDDYDWSVENAGRNAINYPYGEAYRTITLDGVILMAHRVAFLIMEGEWPPNIVDHKNRQPTDNRWENLRHATHTQNLRNSKLPRNSVSGFKGVTIKGGGYEAAVKLGKRRISLGSFRTAREAALAYDAAALQYFGDYACTNAMLGLL